MTPHIGTGTVSDLGEIKKAAHKGKYVTRNGEPPFRRGKTVVKAGFEFALQEVGGDVAHKKGADTSQKDAKVKLSRTKTRETLFPKDKKRKQETTLDISPTVFAVGEVVHSLNLKAPNIVPKTHTGKFAKGIKEATPISHTLPAGELHQTMLFNNHGVNLEGSQVSKTPENNEKVWNNKGLQQKLQISDVPLTDLKETKKPVSPPQVFGAKSVRKEKGIDVADVKAGVENTDAKKSGLEQKNVSRRPTHKKPIRPQQTVSALTINSGGLDKISGDGNTPEANQPLIESGGLGSGFAHAGLQDVRHATTQSGVQNDVQVARSVGVQIRRSVADGISRTVEITLDPVELGKVKLMLHPTENGMNIQIVADRIETVDLMRRNETVMQQEFKDLGYHEFSFSFSQNTERHQSDSAPFTDEEWAISETQSHSSGVVPLVASKARLISTTSLDLRL